MYEGSLRVAQPVPAARGLGLLAVIAVHAVLVAALWHYGPTRRAVVRSTPAILVELLTPPSISAHSSSS